MPVTECDLAAVEFPEEGHLFAALAGDSRLKIEEFLLDGCGGEIVVSHTRNLSTGCDRNRCSGRSISRNPVDSLVAVP